METGKLGRVDGVVMGGECHLNECAPFVGRGAVTGNGSGREAWAITQTLAAVRDSRDTVRKQGGVGWPCLLGVRSESLEQRRKIQKQLWTELQEREAVGRAQFVPLRHEVQGQEPTDEWARGVASRIQGSIS